MSIKKVSTVNQSKRKYGVQSNTTIPSDMAKVKNLKNGDKLSWVEQGEGYYVEPIKKED